MTQRDEPYGNYSEAIPMEKLVKLTNARLASHPDCTEGEMREYARQIVEEELGPSAQSSENIVDALVTEMLRDSDL